MEKLSFLRPSCTDWRNQFESSESLQRLALVAAQSSQAKDSLELLLDWVIPRLGTRAPSKRAVAADVVACAALAAVRTHPSASSVGLWSWVAEHHPLGFASLLRRAHSGSFELPAGW
jgi:hypothetical protein